MQTFGNLSVRTQNEQRVQDAASGIHPRICIKCAWKCHPEEQWCPKCGVVFAKARSTNELPRTSTPASFSVPRREEEFEPLEAESDAPYFLGELRVLSMLASLGTLALIVANPKAD